MTLSELQRLSDDQLVEQVSKQVMGGNRYLLGWNPLTDWNHTMEVAKKLIDDECGVKLYQSKSVSICMIERSSYDGEGSLEESAHEHPAKPQRAIVLAALLAVQQ